jgi:hypothetical protein
MENQISFDVALNFIKSRGSIFDRTKLAIILNDKKENKQKLLALFTSLQNPDGGFPFKGQAKNISTINVTTSYLLSMLDYTIHNNAVFNNGLDFIFSKQYKEGYWNESGLLLAFNPPTWDDPREKFTPIWLTANVCFLLAKLGLHTKLQFNKGLSYLLNKIDTTGKIQGYLQATWLTAATLFLIKQHDSIKLKLMDALESNLAKIVNTSNVIWCLHSLTDGGITQDHLLARKMLENIISLQQQNGRWRSIDGEVFDTSTTLEVILLFKKIGLFNI